jgi:hypothetical protein
MPLPFLTPFTAVCMALNFVNFHINFITIDLQELNFESCTILNFTVLDLNVKLYFILYCLLQNYNELKF